jgi:4-diphosphocytidyl-2-C-methyl-D-erythritol kinase
MPDFPKTWCVVAVPEVGVSTPAAFKAWDELVAQNNGRTSGAKAPHFEGNLDGTAEAVPLTKLPSPQVDKFTSSQLDVRLIETAGIEAAGLTSSPKLDKLHELSLAYSSLSAPTGIGDSRPGTSGILRDQSSEKQRDSLDNTQEHALNDLAENTLLALVRTGIGSDGLHNDFEDVVFPQYPSLRITKRQLMGSDSDGSAIYAALSGSGSALFGLYRSEQDAKAAQQRVQSSGVQALVTETLPRAEYWERMFAE